MSNFYDKETELEILVVVKGISPSQEKAYDLAHKFQKAVKGFVDTGWMNTEDGALEVSASQATYAEPQDEGQEDGYQL